MKKCPECNRDFPDHLINQLVSSLGSFLSCPICALEYSNKLHDENKTDFAGEIASSYLAEAKEFLKQKEG